MGRHDWELRDVVTVSGMVLPDLSVFFGRCRVRGAMIIGDLAVVYPVAFADGDAFGFARGVALASSLGSDNPEDDAIDAAMFDGIAIGIGTLSSSVAVATAVGHAVGQQSGLRAGYALGVTVGSADGEFDGYETGASEMLPVGIAAGATTTGSGSGPSTDTTPPSISGVTPTPGVAPGAPGGFPSDPTAARTTPIGFDVVDLAPGIATVIILARFNDPAGTALPTFVVHNGARFLPPFDAASSRAGDAMAGYHFSIIPSTGWPIDAVSQPSIHLDVIAIDSAGNITGVT